MRLAVPRLGLPLLTKELVEQAARRRTYVVRVVYAILLFVAGFAFYYQIVSRYDSSPFAVLGHGSELFVSIVMLQFMGIYVFMPAMTCGVITLEKERNSLGLLFLTRLGPWTILLEKYLARVIPMFSFLVLSLPMLVIAYALGGITQQYLWTGIWFLSITVFQMGALALFCSSFFRTTVAAFITSYLLTVLMLFTVPVLDEVFRLRLSSNVEGLLLHWGLAEVLGRPWWVLWPFCGPAIFETAHSKTVLQIFFASCPILLLTSSLLLLSRVFLVRRAFLSPTNRLLRVLRRLDSFFHRLNDNRLTKGVVLIKDNVSLTTLIDPIAWRETTKTSLGAFRYLVRLLVVIETPVIVICVLLVAAEGGLEPVGVMVILLWILSTLIISVKATSLVASERSHETLDVLLTTPLTSTEIIQQKYRGVRRLMAVLSVPLLTTILFKTWFVATVGFHRRYGVMQDESWGIYLLCSLLALAVYLPMVAWLSLLIGIRVRSQSKAIFSSLVVLVVWCALPILVAIMVFEFMRIRTDNDAAGFFLLLSPAAIIPMNEFSFYPMFRSFKVMAILINFAWYGAILYFLRLACLRNLDRHLGRSSGALE